MKKPQYARVGKIFQDTVEKNVLNELLQHQISSINNTFEKQEFPELH